MSNSITLTDKAGDTLTIDAGQFGPGTLDITVTEDGDAAEVFWPSKSADEPARRLRDFLNGFLSDDDDREPETANEAKLAVAAEHGLRAKFDYVGESDFGRAYTRRVEVESVWDADNGATLVGGESYDEDGENEGYRQFRLDRIVGEVVVR